MRGLASKGGLEADLFDLNAHLDSTLTFSENKRELSRKIGFMQPQTRSDVDDYALGMERAFQEGLAGEYRPRKSHKYRVLYAKNKKMDAAKQALAFGKRVSVSGRVYYEYRKNKVDFGRRL